MREDENCEKGREVEKEKRKIRCKQERRKEEKLEKRNKACKKKKMGDEENGVLKIKEEKWERKEE